MKRLSILIPVYNVERYLRRCLDSVYTQLPEECEVVLVADGSTDGSGAICDEYAAKFASCTKVVHKKNTGAYNTRNIAMDNADGEYLWLIDPDDFITDGCLGTILQVTEDCVKPDVVSFAYKSCDENTFYELQNAYKTNSSITGAEYLQKYRMNPYLWCKFYRHDFLITNKLRFNDTIYSQGDGLFNIEVFTAAKTVVLTDIYGYNYFNNPNSTLHLPGADKKRKNAHNSLVIIRSLQEFIATKSSFEAIGALRHWQNYGVAGFLHAQIVDHLPISEIRGFIDELKKIGVYPIASTGNKKADLFRVLANCKPLFLLACWVHSLIHK